MKKCLCIIQVLVIILGIFTFSACGKEKTIDAEAAFKALLNDVTYAKELTDVSANAPYWLSGMPDGAEIKMYRVAGGSYSDQLIMITAKSSNDVEAVKASVNAYLAGLKKQAELYKPEEIQKLEDAVIFDSGKNVFVCITEDTDTVNHIFEDQ